MSRIDRAGKQDNTLARRHITQMLRHFEEYEQIKKGTHASFKTVSAFFISKGICKQNFHKYYKRFVVNGRDINQLLPKKRGCRFKDASELYPLDLIKRVKECREKGYNKYEILQIVKKEQKYKISASTIYRLTKRLGLNRLNVKIKEESRKIVKMRAGELGHIDIHYIPKDMVKGYKGKLYILGLIDDYSRVCWVSVIKSIKSLDVMFATMETISIFQSRYGITFDEMMSDNGSEFSARGDKSNHPFERMLDYFDIKHRYIKPYRPQTNGKIERFWKTLDEDLLDGEVFDSVEELDEYLMGYSIYYNEERIHQGINNTKPAEMLA